MKVSVPKGTRDFLPAEVLRRNYIFQTIERVFQRYGFARIETPVMENLDTLTGKYGEEGDRLLFKVLNNGDFLAKADEQALAERNSKALTKSISKRGLRYDLTVPFARFVVQHQNDLSFPFKRYQIQPVWRADRPQKGRYQEFYQCDADVIGSKSVLYEAELISIFQEVFKALNIQVEIQVNHRQILAGIAAALGKSDQLIPMTVAIDKMDKMPWEKVELELEKIGFETAETKQLYDYIHMDLHQLGAALPENEAIQTGLSELTTILDYLGEQIDQVKIDFKLARGLGYYTGCIYEVKSTEVQMGSIAAGGRYDDLTGIFGLSNMSGVGISFGAARIYDILKELDRFPSFEALQPLFILCTEQEGLKIAFRLAQQLRAKGINTDVYPSAEKMKKLLKYANQRAAQNVIIIGSQEIEQQRFTIKDMTSGTQEQLTQEELIEKLSS